MTKLTQLDLRDSVVGTYSALGENLGTFLLLIVGWAALGGAVWYGAELALAAALSNYPEFAESYSSWPDPAQTLLAIFPLLIVSTLGTVSMVVAWHRRIIKGVVPRSPFPTDFSTIVNYLGRIILVFAIPFVPLILFAVGFASLRRGSPGTMSSLTFGPLFTVLVVAAMLVTMRFGLVLPAIAVGDKTMTLSRAWKLSDGNTWRLFWGAFASALPFTIVQRICERLSETTPNAIITGVGLVAEMMSYATAAGFFSFAYMQLAQPNVSENDSPPASHFS